MANNVDTCEIITVYIWPFIESDSIQNAEVSLYASEVISLPAKYKDFIDIFNKNKALELPKANSKVRYSIIIEANKQIPHGHIYPLSINKLRVLYKYLNINLTSGRIYRSRSPIGTPILFIQKKDSIL